MLGQVYQDIYLARSATFSPNFHFTSHQLNWLSFSSVPFFSELRKFSFFFLSSSLTNMFTAPASKTRNGLRLLLMKASGEEI